MKAKEAVNRPVRDGAEEKLREGRGMLAPQLGACLSGELASDSLMRGLRTQRKNSKGHVMSKAKARVAPPPQAPMPEGRFHCNLETK